jgi:hypothetical protein
MRPFLPDSGHVGVELLRQLSHSSIALDGGRRRLRIEGRCVVPAGIVCSLSPLIRRAQRARRRAYRPVRILEAASFTC